MENLEKKIKNAQKLIKDVNKKLSKMECSSCTLKGVKNLSVSDLETLKMYANTFIKQFNFYGFLEPMGEIKEVLIKYDII